MIWLVWLNSDEWSKICAPENILVDARIRFWLPQLLDDAPFLHHKYSSQKEPVGLTGQYGDNNFIIL